MDKNEHARNCCPDHGCYFGDPYCTVMSGRDSGIVCVDCEAEGGGYIDKKALYTVDQILRQKGYPSLNELLDAYEQVVDGYGHDFSARADNEYEIQRLRQEAIVKQQLFDSEKKAREAAQEEIKSLEANIAELIARQDELIEKQDDILTERDELSEALTHARQRANLPT